MNRKNIIIGASIIAGDFYNIEKLLMETKIAGVNYLHLDIMDGNFVPNITFGISILPVIKKTVDIPLDVHLMVNNPESYINDIVDYVDILNFHIEAVKFPFRFIENIKDISSKRGKNIKIGVAINPITDINFLKYLKGYINNVLIMSVDPGYYGQKFIENMIDKIRNVAEIVRDWGDVLISIDGGINDKNIIQVINAGANYVILSSFLYKGEITENIEKLKRILLS